MKLRAAVGQTVFFDIEQTSTATLTCDPGFVLIYNNVSRANDAFDGQWPVATSQEFDGTMLCREVATRDWERLEYD